MPNLFSFFRVAVYSVAIFFAPSAAMASLRIVSLLPSNTEIVDALGAGASVVGVTTFEKDAAAKHRAIVGDFINPSLETIVALKPDLILAGQWKNSSVVAQLRRMGLRVVEIPNPPSMNALFESITQIATVIGRPSAAGPLRLSLEQRLTALHRRAPTPARRTYIEIDGPFWTIGSHDFLSEALCDIGACSVFSDLSGEAGQVSSESIVQKNPDLILSLSASKGEIAARAGWASVSAVRTQAIIDDVSADLLTHPSPRLFDALDLLSQRLQTMKGVS